MRWQPSAHHPRRGARSAAGRRVSRKMQCPDWCAEVLSAEARAPEVDAALAVGAAEELPPAEELPEVEDSLEAAESLEVGELPVAGLAEAWQRAVSAGRERAPEVPREHPSG